MSKFFISCDEATTICDKNQYGSANFFDKIKMILHVFTCKICKCYSKQNGLMTKVYDDYSSERCKKPKYLSKNDKEKIEDAVKEKMK